MARKTQHKPRKKNQPSTVKKGRIVEQIVAAFHDQPNVDIKRNVFLKVQGEGKRRREIDVLVTGNLAGHTVQIAIECKNECVPIGVQKIDEFIGKLKDVGIPYKQGIYVSASGYTEGAIARAIKEGIKPFTLVGLTKEGLSAVLLEAFQALVFLIADIGQFTIEYEEASNATQKPYVFFNSSGQFYGFLHDFVWELWIKNKISYSIGIHTVDLDIPPGMNQLIDGNLQRVKSISVNVRVTGLVVTVPGKAEQYLLVDQSDNTIDRGKVNVSFEIPSSPYPVIPIHTEEELQEFLQGPGVVKIENRVPLPRIRAESCYWPPSERVVATLKERVQALESGDISDLKMDIAELEGTDLSAVWEPVSEYYPGSYAIYGQVKKIGGQSDEQFAQTIEHFRSALVSNPDSHEALINWADALADQATSKTGVESDRLFALAFQKYEAAYCLRPDDYRLLNNWGKALREQATTKTGQRSDTLFHQALDKYDAAFQLNQSGIILLNWGNTLGEYAKAKVGSEADALFQGAVKKYEAISPRTRYYGMVLNNWGCILLEQVKGKTAEEALPFIEAAIERYKAALEKNPHLIDSIENWGNALYEQAKLTSGEEKAGLLDLAIEKYESALRNMAGLYVSFNNLGLVLQMKALMKAGEEADRLFEQACEKYQAALLITPRYPVALCNWGNTLFDWARTKTDDKEANVLFEMANAKFEAALKLKSDMAEALYNWGNALYEQAKIKANKKTDNLLGLACQKLEAAIKIRADYFDALHVLGNVFSEQTRYRTGIEAESLFALATEKYQTAYEIKADSPQLISNWGNTLIMQAFSAPDDQQVVILLNLACEKFESANKLRPDNYYTFKSWGVALSELARRASDEDRKRLFELAHTKFEAAHNSCPNEYDALCAWGNSLFSQALITKGEESHSLFSLATEKFKSATELNAEDDRILNSWGTVLYEQARLKSGKEAEDLVSEAIKKLNAAIQIAPDNSDILNNLGLSLLQQAKSKRGVSAKRLLAQAKQTFLRCETIEPGKGAYNLACVAALENKETECREWLQTSLTHKKLPSRQHLDSDSDLDSVRSHGWFKEFISKL